MVLQPALVVIIEQRTTDIKWSFPLAKWLQSTLVVQELFNIGTELKAAMLPRHMSSAAKIANKEALSNR